MLTKSMTTVKSLSNLRSIRKSAWRGFKIENVVYRWGTLCFDIVVADSASHNPSRLSLTRDIEPTTRHDTNLETYAQFAPFRLPKSIPSLATIRNHEILPRLVFLGSRASPKRIIVR